MKLTHAEPLDARSTAPEMGLDPIEDEDLQEATAYLLDTLRALLDEHVYFGQPEASDYLAAFVLSTYVVNAGLQAPYVVFLSSAPQAGKTVTLDLLAELCRYGTLITAGSGAALARLLEERPYRTLLVDEFDRKMSSADKLDEALIELVNGGVQPSAVKVVSNQQGQTMELRLFGPKVLAGIDNGRWIPAILDRCVIIRSERMPRGVTRKRLNLPALEPKLRAVRHDCARWQRAAIGRVAASAARPAGLDFLSHRLEAGAALPVAVAELAGEDWREAVVNALEALQNGRPAEVEDHRIRLLLDLRPVFEVCAVEGRAPTDELVKALNSEENLPYGGWNRGEGLTTRELLRILRAFDPKIRSRSTRSDGRAVRVLDAVDLAPLWARFESNQDDEAGEP